MHFCILHAFFLICPSCPFQNLSIWPKTQHFFPVLHVFAAPKWCTHVHCLVLKNNPNYVSFFTRMISNFKYKCPPGWIIMNWFAYEQLIHSTNKMQQFYNFKLCRMTFGVLHTDICMLMIQDIVFFFFFLPSCFQLLKILFSFSELKSWRRRRWFVNWTQQDGLYVWEKKVRVNHLSFSYVLHMKMTNDLFHDCMIVLYSWLFTL